MRSRSRRLLGAASAAGLVLALVSACGADTADDTTDDTTPAVTATPAEPAEDTAEVAEPPEGTFFGDDVEVGEGSARTFVVLDDDGNPTEIGVRLSEAALDGLPDAPQGPPEFWELQLPDEADDAVFRFVSLDWASHGHEPPGLFDVPHFDIHFYMIEPEDVAAIDPEDPDFAAKAENVPEPQYIPQDFTTLPDAPLAEQAVPNMGVHWIDAEGGLVPGEYEFEVVFINGTWDGEYTFMEPMVTREFLLSKESYEAEIKQPEAYQRTGYYPTTFSVIFDEATGEHVIMLGGMEMREAS
ncbi:DUF5602 domain-containing protein [Hoyosella sp. YIM 151337]|uniref:DUF5602 domain-containing protein n=1 Tax=Hoyosella sp. YIM 151337 TaxID=2992742 RepID=UPI002236BA4B|nr:DUF5602 domain-containing protein [Hoyosella sp. YIM 151337]MCW4354387.1 DUF5602 domain-containing protein [Hoyosella sp. YIM 151337]